MPLSPERNGRFTASGHAVALGLGRESPQSYWRKWNGLEEFSDEAKARMQWGVEHEKYAIGFCEAVLGEIVERTGDDQLWTPYEDWCGATTDGLIGDLALVEAKCPVRLYDTPPESYWCQVQSQMAITKRTSAYLSCWTPEASGLWMCVSDPIYWTTAEPLLKSFWLALKQGEPPKRMKKPKLDFRISWERLA